MTKVLDATSYFWSLHHNPHLSWLEIINLSGLDSKIVCLWEIFLLVLCDRSMLVVLLKHSSLFYVWHACFPHYFHLKHALWQAVPCLRSPHCCSHMPVGSWPQQPKPPEWEPYLPQTLAMGTRIVNNMWVPAWGTLLLRANKISVKSHLQTAAKYKCSHLCH